jgi:hypothetical protein
LSQLSNDFQSASSNGQLPNVQDLATAMTGGHHHRRHSGAGQISSSNSSDSSSNNSTSSQALAQLLSAFTSNSLGSASSLDPASIIENTLASAGITPSGN